MTVLEVAVGGCRVPTEPRSAEHAVWRELHGATVGGPPAPAPPAREVQKAMHQVRSRAEREQDRRDADADSPGAGLRQTSRRDLFAPHAFNPLTLRRCPICQWAIEQDHAEALGTTAAQDPRPSGPASGCARGPEAQEEALVVDFALV
jgi:hypothetical protein